MVRTGVARFSALALAALVAGACGSGPGARSTVSPTTAPPVAPLHLAAPSRAGVAAMPSGASAALAPLRPQKFVLDTALSDLGSTATVFRMRPQSAAPDDVRRLAQAFGVGGAPQRDQNGWHVSGTDSTLSVFTGNGATHVSYSYGAVDASRVRPEAAVLRARPARESRSRRCPSSTAPTRRHRPPG